MRPFFRSAGETAGQDSDRVLATVLFTDIVGSTAPAAELGDRGLHELEAIPGQWQLYAAG